MAWLRQLLDWQKETEDPGEFLESLRFDLSCNEVFVFTPNDGITGLLTTPGEESGPRETSGAGAPGLQNMVSLCGMPS